MPLSDELAYASVADLAERIRRKVLSPLEVVDAFIARIETRNPRLNAIVYEGFDDARVAAQQAERELMLDAPIGLLHGVPAAIKDLFDFKPGWPATFGGIRALKDNVSDNYCTFAQRIEEAGAIILGKTNSPVMGLRGTCDNYLFGPTRNPFDLTRNSGGSSGGSAAAVADGMLPFAEGTDGGGSIRTPAAWCGVYGYKASYGRVPNVSRPNAFGSIAPFAFKGPITRTVGDAALVLSAILGYDARDPFALDERIDLRSSVLEPIAGLRIAYSSDFDVFPVQPEIRTVLDAAVLVFEAAGARVEEVRLGIEADQRELSDVWTRLIMPSNIQALEGLKAKGIDLIRDHPGDLPPEYRERIEKGYRLTVLDRLHDERERTKVYDAIQRVFGTYDLLVTPTVSALPVANADDGNTMGPSEINGVEVDPLIGWCLGYLVNFTGHPAASLPAGTHRGLPVGMQIVGRRYRDADVLAASAAFERLRPWSHTYRDIIG